MREFAMLEHVYAANPALGEAVRIAPGDDMAMIRVDGVNVLAAVDQVIDGVHVDLTVTPLELVGRKAITRCLSDVAAMAAQPVASLVAVVLPQGFGEGRAQQLFDAMRETAAKYGAPLIGGDIAIHRRSSAPLTCSVTVLARPGPRPPVTRAGARAGDCLYVTGTLGGAVENGGGGRHLTFEPRIDLALALANRLGERLHAMIDLSDGLGRDASHLAEMSKVDIVIEANAVPRHEGVDWRSAMSGGEDYELCFTANGDVPPDVLGVPVTRVGRVTASVSERGRVTVQADRQTFDAQEMGWQHVS